MRCFILILITSLILLVTPVSRSQVPATSPKTEMQKLRDLVASLQERLSQTQARLFQSEDENAELKKEIARLRAELNTQPRFRVFPRTPSTQPFRFEIPNPLIPRQYSLPKNWEERQFNGQSYYLIPLESDSKH